MSPIPPFILLFLSLFIYASATSNLFYTYCPNTASRSNAAALLSSLSAAANTTSAPGFLNSTVGTVHGLYLCRGDVGPATCRDCVAAASAELTQSCPRGKQAVTWFDECMIRYSSVYFFGQLDDTFSMPMYNTQNATDADFDIGFALGAALQTVKSQVVVSKAAHGMMFGTAEENITSTNSTKTRTPMYMLGQCTQDLSTDDCIQCLQAGIDSLQQCCRRQRGARIYFFSCILRYELYQFYNLSSSRVPAIIHGSSPPPPTPKMPLPGKSTHRHIPVIISCSVISMMLILILSLWFFGFKRKFKATSIEDLSDIITAESLQMDFSTIRAATQNFAIDRKLGQGGFGAVYKGMLENGQGIAVKRLADNSGQGIVEFKTEVLLVAKLQHRNLVKLLGFCVSGKEKLLVYEFLPNSSLDKILFDPTKRMSFNWEARFKIICGIAKGLMYLHEDSRLKVVHRDLKSSNILLDEAMNPKISDFGLAKLFGVDQTQAITDSIAGTYLKCSIEKNRLCLGAYLKISKYGVLIDKNIQVQGSIDVFCPPEYILMGHYSIKSDVYSFGIIVLEVVSGQRNKYRSSPSLEEALLYRAWKLWNEDEPLKLMDETIGENYSREDVIKCIHIGLLCIQESVAKRPNMTPVVAALGGQSITLPLPSPPNFFNNSNTTSTVNTSGISSGEVIKIDEISEITELHGR